MEKEFKHATGIWFWTSIFNCLKDKDWILLNIRKQERDKKYYMGFRGEKKRNECKLGKYNKKKIVERQNG